MRGETVDDEVALTEASRVDERDLAVAAQQGNGAPTEPAVADRFAWIADHCNLDGVAGFGERLRCRCDRRLPREASSACPDAVRCG